jgi:hypothetical protein
VAAAEPAVTVEPAELAAQQAVPAASQALRVSMATVATAALPVTVASAARVLMAAQVRPDPVPVFPVMRARPAETVVRAA